MGAPDILDRVSTVISRRSRQGNRPVLFGIALLVILGVLGYYFVYGSSGSPAPAAGEQPAGGGAGAGAHGGAGGSLAHLVVIHLTAVQASTVEFTMPGGKILRSTIAAGASKKWTFHGPVTMRVGNPGAVRLLVDGKNPLHGPGAHPVTLSLSPGRPPKVTSLADQPTPAATHTAAGPQLRSGPLIPVSVAAFGPGGAGQGDNPAEAPLAIDKHSSTSWNTDWYASARFGNLYSGTGLLLDMGRTVTITSAAIDLGSAPGATFELRAGNSPTMPGLPVAARASNASGTVKLQLSTPVQARYVLIWFTRLPLNANGNFEASVYNAALEGRS